MTPKYRFPCGCEWPIIEENPPADAVPFLDFDEELAPVDCPAAWALLGRGETKGVFQLESPLGRRWTKTLRPETLEHIGALGALLRPGCIRAEDEEGVSTTSHYCRRKNGLEEVKSYHPAVDAILFPTYGVLVYQEQAMFICVAVAGFNEQEADMLRKAIGKKLPEEMAKCEKMFVEGVKRMGIVPEEMGARLFADIKESQRYSFNKSHSTCYGVIGYHCAYVKAHFPLAFFTGWLSKAKHKNSGGGPQQEIHELVNDAKRFDIVVEVPDLRTLEADFHTDRKVVKFGLSNIKGIGPAQIVKMATAVKEAEADAGPMVKWTWLDFLFYCSGRLSASVVTRLIEVGALRWLGKPRQEMLAEYKAWNELTEKEQAWVSAAHKERLANSLLDVPGLLKFTSLVDALQAVGRPKKEGGGAANKNRVAAIISQAALLLNPPTPCVDSPAWIAYAEQELLGIPITCTKIDACDISEVNTSCKDYVAGRTGFMLFGVTVEEAHEIKTKRGKNPGSKMGRLTISDGTCAIEAVAFPEVWKEFGHLLVEDNAVILQGERETNAGYDSLIVKKVWQATQGRTA